MVRLLVEKELREIAGSTKFAVTFGVCAVLILLAFYVGARNYQISRAEYEAARAENISQMEGLTEWDEVDHRVFLPPQPLAALVSGIANDIGRTVEMRTRGELRAEGSRFNEDPLFAVFRFLDLEFIFTIVLSLFAILFAYDAVNGEKQRGTLRLAFANAVPRDQYILGKLIGAFLALAVPLLVPILLGCLLLPLMGVPMDADAWLRLGLVILAGYLYLGVFLTLSVFVSALTRQASTSFLFLLVVWIFAVLIVPRTAVLLSARAVEVPSVDAVNFQKARYARQLWEEDRPKMQDFARDEQPQTEGLSDEERQQAFQQFIARFSERTNELREARDEKLADFTRQLNEERRNRERIQQRWALNLARLSPTAAFSMAATHLAATSLALKQRFDDEVDAYQTAYAQFIESKGGGQFFRFTGPNDEEEEEEPIDPQELPQFTYAEPAAGELAAAASVDLGLLALFNVLFFAGAFVAFLRYDVR